MKGVQVGGRAEKPCEGAVGGGQLGGGAKWRTWWESPVGVKPVSSGSVGARPGGASWQCELMV